MKRQIFLGGLAVAAFVLTLATYGWREGFWHSAAVPPSITSTEPNQFGAAPRPAVASHADAPSESRPSTQADATVPASPTQPPAAVAPAEAPQGESQYEQIANPGVDSEAMRRDRGVQHSSAPH